MSRILPVLVLGLILSQGNQARSALNLLEEPAAQPAIPKKTIGRVESARIVVAAVVAAADDNQRRAKPWSGDALTEYYFRAAANATKNVPPSQAAPAYLLGLAIALDTSPLLRQNPVSGPLWKRIESEAERQRRLKVIGLPTIHGRHDLCQHFVVSCGLTAANGAAAAEAAGVVKELLDSQDGGSGFSFCDLAADLSGVAFAKELIDRPERIQRVADNFTVKNYALSPLGLVEDLKYADFEARYGSVTDPRFKEQETLIRKRIRELPGHKDEAPSSATRDGTK